MRKIILFIVLLINSLTIAAQLEKGMWMASGNFSSGVTAFENNGTYNDSYSTSIATDIGYFPAKWWCYGSGFSYSFHRSIQGVNSRLFKYDSYNLHVSPFIRGYLTSGKVAVFAEINATGKWNKFVRDTRVFPVSSPFLFDLKARLAADFFLSPNLAVEAGATLLLHQTASRDISFTPSNRLSLNVTFKQFLRPGYREILPDWDLESTFLQRHNFYFSGSIQQNYTLEGTRDGTFQASIGYFMRDQWLLNLGIALNNSLYYNPQSGKYISVIGNFGLSYFAKLGKSKNYLVPSISFQANTARYEEFAANNPRNAGASLAFHRFVGSRWHCSTGGRYNYNWVIGEIGIIEKVKAANVFLSLEYSILPEWSCYFEFQTQLYHDRKASAELAYEFNNWQSFSIGFRRFIFSEYFYED